MDTNGITDALSSHLLALGVFERVNFHEATNQPGNGLTAACWVDTIEPVAEVSGLDATSAKLVFQVRLYTSVMTTSGLDADAIDPGLVAAIDTLMAAYSGDFDLGGTVKQVDLLGQHGTPLSAQAGYLNMDGKIYRVITVTLPLIVNDAWAQVS